MKRKWGVSEKMRPIVVISGLLLPIGNTRSLVVYCNEAEKQLFFCLIIVFAVMPITLYSVSSTSDCSRHDFRSEVHDARLLR